MMIFPPFDRDNERNLEVKEPPEQATSSKQKQGQRCAWGWGSRSENLLDPIGSETLILDLEVFGANTPKPIS